MTTDRYPDLAGKVAVVAGEPAEVILEVVRVFAANRMPVAVVAADRNTASAAAELFNGTDVGVIAVTADAADPAVWQRVAPHAEQRLGPIDVVVVAGRAAIRDLVAVTLLADMGARKRGVIIEISPDAATRAVPEGVTQYVLADATGVAAAAREGSR